MDFKQLYDAGAAILVTVGFTTVVMGSIIYKLSAYIGNITATRIIANEKASHEMEMRRLQDEGNQILQQLNYSLDITKHKSLTHFQDKLQAYRSFIELLAEILGDFDAVYHAGKKFSPDHFIAFNKARLKAYGFIAIISPQAVLSAQDEVMDYLMSVYSGTESYIWKDIRNLGLILLNEMRKDLGVDVSEIGYFGNR